MSTVLPRALCVGLAFAIGVTSARAHGQADEKRAAARTLANDGLRAFNEGRHADAVDLFTRAEALVHAPPHLLYIARASNQLGKLVQAREAYVKISREELQTGAPKAFVEAQKAATSEQAALEQRIPKLTIVVKGQAATDATVTMDGVQVPRALVGVSHPVDPGAHSLRATAPGWTSAETVVKIAEGAVETATIELTTPAPTAEATAAPQAAKPRGEAKTAPSRIAPWVAFGVGAVGLGVGTVFLMQNRSKHDEADAICGDGLCPSARRSEIESLDEDGDRAATFAWVGYGVAAAGILTGATLLIVSRPSSEPKTGSSVRPWIGAGSAGLRGRF